MIITKEGEILRVEVIGTPSTPKLPDRDPYEWERAGAARINVKGFKHPERKK